MAGRRSGQFGQALTAFILLVHTEGMAVVRKTISLPASLAEELEEEARRRGISFSALMAERAAAGEPTRLSYAGIIEDDPDLSLKVEEILKRLWSED